MSNKLFLVCPFSFMENFIKGKFGDDVFFLTAPATVFQFDDENYVIVLSDFIIRENITEVFIVNDTSCQFLNKVLKREPIFEIFAQYVIQDLFVDYYSDIMSTGKTADQLKRFIELNISRQVKDIINNQLFQKHLIRNKVSIKGLITTKLDGDVIELNFNSKGSLK